MGKLSGWVFVLTDALAELRKKGITVKEGTAAGYQNGVIEYGPGTRLWELLEEELHHRVKCGEGAAEIKAIKKQIKRNITRTHGGSPGIAAEEVYVKQQLLLRDDLDAPTRTFLENQIQRLMHYGLRGGY